MDRIGRGVASKARVAVIGSCCTRDAFNSLFVPNHSERFQLVAEAFQPSFIAMMDSPIGHDPSAFSVPEASAAPWAHSAVLPFDLAKPCLLHLASTQPDIAVFDFYADIWWGIRQAERSAMGARSDFIANGALAHTAVAPVALTPLGSPKAFLTRFRAASRAFASFARRWLPHTKLVVHQARCSWHTRLGNGSLTRAFRRTHCMRFEALNLIWAAADRIFMEETGAQAVTHRNPLVVDRNYPHGGALNPVHYEPSAHRELLNQLSRIAELAPLKATRSAPEGVNSLNLLPNGGFAVPGAGWMANSPAFSFPLGSLQVRAEHADGHTRISAFTLPVPLPGGAARLHVGFDYTPSPEDRTRPTVPIASVRSFSSPNKVNATDALGVHQLTKEKVLTSSSPLNPAHPTSAVRYSGNFDLEGQWARLFLHAPTGASYTISRVQLSLTPCPFSTGIPGLQPSNTPVKPGVIDRLAYTAARAVGSLQRN